MDKKTRPYLFIPFVVLLLVVVGLILHLHHRSLDSDRRRYLARVRRQRAAGRVPYRRG